MRGTKSTSPTITVAAKVHCPLSCPLSGHIPQLGGCIQAGSLIELDSVQDVESVLEEQKQLVRTGGATVEQSPKQDSSSKPAVEQREQQTEGKQEGQLQPATHICNPQAELWIGGSGI
jgi:hypothetical protein